MDVPIHTKQNSYQDSSNKERENGLASLKKKLESGEEINPLSIKEMAARNLNQTKNILENPTNQITPMGDLHGENNIMGNKKIDSNFFLKQKGLSSSIIPHNGGRL